MRLDFSDALDHLPDDEDAFKDEVEIILNDNTDAIPLYELTRHNGSTEDVSLSDLDVDAYDDVRVYVDFFASFTEARSGGCKDISISDVRGGRFRLTIDRKSGTGSIELLGGSDE